jgi:chromate transporter
VAAVAGVHPLAILAGAAVTFLAVRGVVRESAAGLVAAGIAAGPARGGTVGLLAIGGASLGAPAILLLFAGLGCVTFGSGYLLVTFLHEALVVPGIVSDRVLLDAIAVGQLTPGPLFTSATFIGYELAGIPGAIAATVGIFLPSFVLVALVHPMLARVRASARLATALDGVNAASIGLLAAVAAQLAGGAITGVGTAAIGLVAALLVLPGRVGPTIAIVGGAAAGIGLGALGLMG